MSSFDGLTLKLSRAVLRVSDISKSKDFYTNGLKMKVIEELQNENGQPSYLLGFDRDGFQLQISSHIDAGASSVFKRGEVTFSNILNKYLSHSCSGLSRYWGNLRRY